MSRAEAPRTTVERRRWITSDSSLFLLVLHSGWNSRISGIIFRKQSEEKYFEIHCFIAPRNNRIREIGVSTPTQICRYPLRPGLRGPPPFSPPFKRRPYVTSIGTFFKRSVTIFPIDLRVLKTFNIAATARLTCVCSIETRGLQGRNSSSHFRGNGTAATMAVTVDSR